MNAAMKPPTKDVSVILGCYNGAARVENSVLELAEFLSGINRSHEIIVVDDGSLDDSALLLRRLESSVPSLMVLRNPKNMGKGFSIRNGMLNSCGKYVVFCDLDLAYSMKNMQTVLEKLAGGCQIVVGDRRLPQSVYTVNNTLVKYVYRRHRTGIAFNFLVRLLFGLSTRDTQCGLKGFQRETAAQIFTCLHTDGFLFDVEIFIRARALGISVEEIPVHLTYETDESSVQQLGEFFRIVPVLTRIKLLDVRGAYDAPCPEENLPDGADRPAEAGAGGAKRESRAAEEIPGQRGAHSP